MNRQLLRPSRQIKYLAFGLLLLVLNGCVLKHDPKFAPSRPVAYRPQIQNNGAIYQPGNNLRLFEDQIARNVGDVLTVILVENTAVTKNDDLDQSKESDLALEPPTVYGYPLSFLEQNIGFNREFRSKNKGKQDNNLNGTVSVTVIEVLSNGNLVVQGEKRLGLTGGNEYVKFSGIVRPVDIDAANTIPSTKVADATVVYEGEGQMADASKKGWLERFFYSPWFPF